ncbi:Protein translation factor sui1 [Smittium mucronatum]|uniref:Protein translation factor sui1 n=1 Tax=Smittium mucronatum TaxID=133383 RepID=A0A1R0GPT2_9FUNG|nr:Protein translation factor sui1 [Smittium mucronatum]
MSNLQNLKTYDPFADTGETDAVESQGYIHIRIQQRNGRKTITSLQGLPEEFDQKRLLKAFKKVFACNGTIVDDEDLGQVIQLQGDQRTNIRDFLVDEKIYKKEMIKVHGF